MPVYFIEVDLNISDDTMAAVPSSSLTVVGAPTTDNRGLSPTAELYLLDGVLHSNVGKKSLIERGREWNRLTGGGHLALDGWNTKSLSNLVRNLTSLFYYRGGEGSRYPKNNWIVHMERQGARLLLYVTHVCDSPSVSC